MGDENSLWVLAGPNRILLHCYCGNNLGAVFVVEGVMNIPFSFDASEKAEIPYTEDKVACPECPTGFCSSDNTCTHDRCPRCQGCCGCEGCSFDCGCMCS